MKPAVRALILVIIVLCLTQPSLLCRAQTPSGRLYVGGADNDYHSTIFGTNLDGSNTVAFTGTPNRWAGHPSLSSDGSLIAFVEEDPWYEGGYQSTIWVCNGDGSNPRQLTTLAPGNPNGTYDNYAAISPDGTKIAFSSQRNGEIDQNGQTEYPNELYVINSDGTGLTMLTQSDLVNGPNGVQSVVWGPDNKTILFRGLVACWGYDEDGNYLYGNHYGVYSIQSDGTNLQQVVPIETANCLDWSRDGRYILYGSYQQNNIHVRDLTTGTETTIANPTYMGDYDDVRFSPDGTQIAIDQYYSAPLLIVDHSGNVLNSLPVSTIFASTPGWDTNSDGLWWQNAAPIPTPKHLTLSKKTVTAKPGQTVPVIPVLKDAKGNIIAQVPFTLTISPLGDFSDASVWDTVKYLLTPDPGTTGAFQITVSNAGLTATQTLFWGTPKINKIVIQSDVRNSDGSITMSLHLYNTGTAPAVNVTITGATLNGIAGTITGPSYAQTLLIGSDIYTGFDFPPGTLATGAAGTLKLTGTYLGGKFSVSKTITGP